MLRKLMIGAAAAALVAGSTLPAAAQFSDFFCSTFNVGCPEPPPPPPPPPPAPVVDPVPEKPVHHKRKHVVKKAPKAEVAPAAAAPAAGAPQ